MTSFLLLCISGVPKDDIYKLQQDKYCLANEKKCSQWEHPERVWNFPSQDFQKLTAQGHKQCNLTLKLPLQGTAQMLANTTQEKGRKESMHFILFTKRKKKRKQK